MPNITCYRCGYCCFHLRVRIIDPSYIELLKEITDPNKIKDYHIMIKEPNKDCPYLKWIDKNTTICTIHEYPVFTLTVCYYFSMSFNDESYCLVGHYIKTNDIDTRQYIKSLNQN